MVKWASKLIVGWALLGGFILLLVVLMTTYSSAAGFLIATPFPGDFELTEIGIAVASFTFLPYCQLTFANVSADVFTSKMSPSKVRFLSRIGSLVATAFSTLLIWRMYEGLLDYQMYLETTTILQIPIWYAFVPAIFSLLLLLLASIITFVCPDGVAEPFFTHQ
jgi:TRAP-type C4-dicarboxylate transport system permease small subunit